MRFLVVKAAALAVGACATVAGGCAAGLDESRAMSRVIEEAPASDVVLAAREVLRREFGAIEIDRAPDQMRTRPVEFDASTGSGTARDFVRATSTLRRYATFSAVQRGSGVVVRLRVDVERQDAARREITRSGEPRLGDGPGYTPIERDAAVTSRQNSVWTPVRRDTALERALLEEIEARFVREPASLPAEAVDADG